MARDTLQGMLYLLSRNILHRDLKSLNLLVTKKKKNWEKIFFFFFPRYPEMESSKFAILGSRGELQK